MSQDQEIIALSMVYDTLKELNNSQIERIIEWITSKFGLLDEKSPVEVSAVSESGVAPTPVADAELAREPLEEIRGRPPRAPRTAPHQAELAGITGFLKYDSVEDLFFSSNARTVASKILLVAAYLQEKHNLKELSSFDINTRLKKVGHGVQNITTSINTLMNKKPPLMIQTGKSGDTKQAKRKFRVTEEGLRIARNYITEQ